MPQVKMLPNLIVVTGPSFAFDSAVRFRLGALVQTTAEDRATLRGDPSDDCGAGSVIPGWDGNAKSRGGGAKRPLQDDVFLVVRSLGLRRDFLTDKDKFRSHFGAPRFDSTLKGAELTGGEGIWHVRVEP